MIQAWIAKKIAGAVISKVMQKRAIKKMQKYVEEPNDADDRIDALEIKVSYLERFSHEPQEYICCRRCGCKINKTKSKSKKRRK